MELSRTLNAQETIARGCALQAAFLSPKFKTQKFEVVENNAHQVCIEYKFDHAEGAPKTSDLFKPGANFPSLKTITFDNKLGGMDLLVKYGPNAKLLEGLPTNIAQYKIAEGKLDTDKQITKYSFVAKVSNNIHGICELESAELVQEWNEEEKIPIKSGPSTVPKPEAPQTNGEADKPNQEEPPKEGEASKEPEGGEAKK